jgi:hypothetical protein
MILDQFAQNIQNLLNSNNIKAKVSVLKRSEAGLPGDAGLPGGGYVIGITSDSDINQISKAVKNFKELKILKTSDKMIVFKVSR